MIGNYKETELHTRLLKPYEQTLSREHTAKIEATVDAENKLIATNITTNRFNTSELPRAVHQQPKKVKSRVATKDKEKLPVDNEIKTPVASEFQAKNLVSMNSKTAIVPPLSVEFNVKSQEGTRAPVKLPVTTTTYEQEPNISLEQAYKDITTMMEKSKEIDLHDDEEYATFSVWDFAGDEEFYHTHQAFLSQDAIYIVLTKLNEADDKTAHGRN